MINHDTNDDYKKLIKIVVIGLIVLVVVMVLGIVISDAIYHSKK